MKQLSKVNIEYYEPQKTDVDELLFILSKGDISKKEVIENFEVMYCYEWYYLLKVKDLNELKFRVKEYESYQSSSKL